ncbi:MAG TPA: helicase HerA-like domain-containing protein [Methanocella sp.]|uniref:ATP-binding protein n=1 Tax=Methanocella sp. TaxID=2052833 RepID=UPI002B858262|nr:helicase HerA-like domain-containing protein [Methanocella sp.]HTY90858.1 helicase HerA-like domain-containing protein [Methanocella sp.]
MSDEKRYLLGRRDGGEHGLLYLGRYLALDGSQGAGLYLDVLKPHAVLICGKRGYGKSYTMGVIIEEMASLPQRIRDNFCVIVVDTMGVFTGMGRWKPDTVRVFAPPAHRHKGTLPLEIPAGSLSFYDYCELMDIEPLSDPGVELMNTLDDGPFDIEELIKKVKPGGTLAGLLRMVASWRLFSRGAAFDGLLKPGSVNILDLSGYGHEPQIRSAIVASMARALYDVRVEARRLEAGRREKPLVWLLIDEAHMFMDAGADTGASRALNGEWLRQGRQPGLSLVLATQRPSALGKEVLSQADLIICHRLTLQDDLEALESARPTYVNEPVPEAMARLGTGRGAAVVIDDATESYHVIKIRPRESEHGGGEPDVYMG